MYRIVEIMMMSAYDFLKERFQDERVMAMIAYYASIGMFTRPKSFGSTYVIMHYVMCQHEGARLGLCERRHGSDRRGSAAYTCIKGVKTVTGADTKEVSSKGGLAVAVKSADLRSYEALVIASNASATTLYRDRL
ncbi:MAG: hypothetical protein AAGI03_17765 [Pseudomonadota bacterium]